MFWIAGGSSKITTLLSTGVQSIEFQLPTQSRQGSPSAFFGQQWIQLEGLMGPWGSVWFPSLEVRICLLSLLFYILFPLANRCQTLPKGGDRCGRGRSTCHPETGQGSHGSFFCVHKKGAWGGWLHYCPLVVGRVGDGTSAALATTWQESQSPGSLQCCLTHSGESSTCPPGPLSCHV